MSEVSSGGVQLTMEPPICFSPSFVSTKVSPVIRVGELGSVVVTPCCTVVAPAWPFVVPGPSVPLLPEASVVVMIVVAPLSPPDASSSNWTH